MKFSGLTLLFTLAAAETWDELWRPQFHQSTPSNWGNDPNGMVFDGEKYHLFYQHYPNAPKWGPMHWGHSTSVDLLTWDHHDIKVTPRGVRNPQDNVVTINGVNYTVPAEDMNRIGMAFSGSAIFDETNTHGHGSRAIILMWTEHSEVTPPGASDHYLHERQVMGFMLPDDGYSTVHYLDDQDQYVIRNTAEYNFEYYDGTEFREGEFETDIRDPKIVQYDNQTYLSIIANCDRIVFYRSQSQLRDFVPVSAFGVNRNLASDPSGLRTHTPDCVRGQPSDDIWGVQGGVWECPDLVKMTVEGTDDEFWVLIVSIGENQGSNDAVNRGSGTMYFVGQFDGNMNFIPVESFESYPKWIDYGPDNYAGVTYNNAPNGEFIFQSWMSNWLYAQTVPTGELGWRSGMTLPRKLKLVNLGTSIAPDYRITQEFISLSPIHHDFEYGTLAVLGGLATGQFTTGGLDLKVSVSGMTLQTGEFYGVEIRSPPPVNNPNNLDDMVVVGLRVTGNGNVQFEATRGSSHIWTIEEGDEHEQEQNEYNQWLLTQNPTAPRLRAATSDLTMHIVVDHGSVEAIFDDGEVSFTILAFPGEPFHQFTVRVPSGQATGSWAAILPTVDVVGTTPLPSSTSPSTTQPTTIPEITTAAPPTCPEVTCPEVTCPEVTSPEVTCPTQAVVTCPTQAVVTCPAVSPSDNDDGEECVCPPSLESASSLIRASVGSAVVAGLVYFV